MFISHKCTDLKYLKEIKSLKRKHRREIKKINKNCDQKMSESRSNELKTLDRCREFDRIYKDVPAKVNLMFSNISKRDRIDQEMASAKMAVSTSVESYSFALMRYMKSCQDRIDALLYDNLR